MKIQKLNYANKDMKEACKNGQMVEYQLELCDLDTSKGTKSLY